MGTMSYGSMILLYKTIDLILHLATLYGIDSVLGDDVMDLFS